MAEKPTKQPTEPPKTPEVKKIEDKTTPEVKKENKETSKEVAGEQKKKVSDAQEKFQQMKSILKEKKASETEKRDFLGKYKYESNSDNPPAVGSEDAWVEEHYFGDEKRDRETSEKEAVQSLKEKHEAEIVEALQKFDFTSLDEETRKTIHIDVMSANVNIEKIPKEIKDAALKWVKVNGKPVDMAQPLTDDQKELVQKYAVKEFLEGRWKWKWTIGEVFWEEFTESPKLILLLNEKAFFEEVKNDPSLLKSFIESVKNDGMLVNGIDPKSELGKSLVKIMEENVNEYTSINKPQDGLLDVENFKWLKDVLGGSYEDLLYTGDFLLWENHIHKKNRDAVLAWFKDELAQLWDPDLTDSKKVQEYKKSVEKAFTDATGVDGWKAEKAIGRISRSKLSPLVRFLADLLAPLGALMGGEVGEFWRKYMAENAANNPESKYWESRTKPFEWKWVENASASAIYNAAKAYDGKTSESSTPDLIRQMHASAGLNAGPGTPWCMSFVQHVLRHDMWFNSAQIGPPTASAAAGHKIGRHTDTPKPWDIVLIHRTGGSGRHIGFVDSMNADGSVNVLGGNQSNSVCVSRNSRSSVAEFRTLENAPNPVAQDNWSETWHEWGQNTLPNNKGSVEKVISYNESLSLMANPSTPKYDEQWRLIIYKVDISGYKRDAKTQEIYNKNIGRGDKDKHFIAVHGTASDYGVSGGLTDEKLDQSGFHQMLATGLYPYFVTKKGIVLSTTENDANHPACVNDKANTITGYDRLNNKGIAIEMSLRADGKGSVEKPNETQMKSGRELILALRGKYNIGAANVITSKDPVRDPVTGEFKGEHSDDFDDAVRTAMGIAKYADTAKRFREKKFFTDSLATNNTSWSSGDDIDKQIALIKNNESGNTKGNEWYAWWNSTENFPSMGFAHFIWWKNTGHGNSFHEMMQYISQKWIQVPSDLSFLLWENPPNNWQNLSTMQDDPRYESVASFLSKPDVKRAGYNYIQNTRLWSLRNNLSGPTLEKFNILANGSKGSYILTDYVNFKGEGLSNQSTYGLRQVLENMPMPSDATDAAEKFRDTAKALLSQRSDSEMYIKWWTDRLNTYVI